MADCNSSGRVWGVVWSEILPWLIIFRTFRIATSLRLLVLGATGMMAMLFGSYAVVWCFSGDATREGLSSNTAAVTIQNTDWYSYVFGFDANVGWRMEKGSDGVRVVPPREFRFNEKNPGILDIWNHFKLPFELAVGSRYWLRNLGCCMAIGLWTALVWGFFGTAIARSAALGLVRGGQTSLREMLGFAWSKWRAGFASPLLPFLGMLLLAVPILLLGLLLRLGFLAWIGAIAWPVALCSGLVITILMLGLIFGWPLMISAIAVEGSDSFDALSRTYAYLYQKPLQALFYTCLAILFGAIGWFVVLFFAKMTISTTEWIGNWAIIGLRGDNYYTRSSFEIIRVWVILFRLVVLGFSATYFWSAAVAIYLLLRRDTDAVEMDEIYTKSEAVPRGLPKIVTDEKGAPASSLS